MVAVGERQTFYLFPHRPVFSLSCHLNLTWTFFFFIDNEEPKTEKTSKYILPLIFFPFVIERKKEKVSLSEFLSCTLLVYSLFSVQN